MTTENAATKHRAVPGAEASNKPTVPKPSKHKKTNRFADGFAALDLYSELPTSKASTSKAPPATTGKKTNASASGGFAKGFAKLDLYPDVRIAQRPCFACGDEQPESKSYNMECINGHWSCVDCLKDGFEAYFKDFKNPPRCCDQPVSFHEVASTVFWKGEHKDFVERGLKRMADLSQMMADKRHTFHCAWPDCGTPLKELGRSGKKKFGICSKCEKKTCETCKSPWISGHSTQKCHNSGNAEIEALAESLNLKTTKCPHCKRSNVKTEGCNLVQW
ncbi:hypothetical protein ACMFMF_001839 [Clarireedia jacksonii]